MSDTRSQTDVPLQPLSSQPGPAAYALISFPREDGQVGHMVAGGALSIDQIARAVVVDTQPPIDGWQFTVTIVRAITSEKP